MSFLLPGRKETGMNKWILPEIRAAPMECSPDILQKSIMQQEAQKQNFGKEKEPVMGPGKQDLLSALIKRSNANTK